MRVATAFSSRIRVGIVSAVLATLWSLPSGAAVPIEREISGTLDAWDARHHYVIVDGRRYVTMESVLTPSSDRGETAGLVGSQVTLQFVGEEVYSIVPRENGS
ncbi:hypothetical protein [Ectothiorhodospira sp. BSL-9]|uniref:hypothetical protein n=1 Tax=Ectothiorhodospira sp. BSL-9 TaxID=1442136 RepID=UPI0012E8291A|nr:hypothetical protein [Ectothiorhodospira sp. BSL-9]